MQIEHVASDWGAYSCVPTANAWEAEFRGEYWPYQGVVCVIPDGAGPRLSRRLLRYASLLDPNTRKGERVCMYWVYPDWDKRRKPRGHVMWTDISEYEDFFGDSYEEDEDDYSYSDYEADCYGGYDDDEDDDGEDSWEEWEDE